MTINVNCPPRGLFIGRETENVARTLDVDFSAWAAEHGPGTLQVLLQRPGDSAPYPVTITVDGTVATWKPSETDLAEAGTGAVQLVYTTAAGVREKTQIIPVMVEPSLGVESDPPEGWTSWLDQLTDLAAETEQHAASAAQSAENAAASATGAQRSATDAESAKDAAVAAAEAAAASASHYPQIVGGVWYVWSPTAGEYISTGIDAQGEDGVSPTVEITAIQGGHRVVITDAAGPHTFDVLDGVTPDLSAYRTAEDQDVIDDAQDDQIADLKSALDTKAGRLVDTASGSVASFVPDATVPNLLGLDVHLSPIQDLHGYDSPWPAGGGKNKFDPSAVTFKKWHLDSNSFATVPDSSSLVSVSVNGEEITITNSAAYYGVGFEIDAADADRVFSVPSTIGGAVQFWSAYEDGATRISTGSTSCAIPANTSGFIAFRHDVTGSVTTKAQLESGSTATDWTPYSNLCPISGRDSVEVEAAGVNLWHGQLANNANVVFDTKPGRTYTVSAQLKGSNGCYLYVQSSNDGFVTTTTVGRVITGTTIRAVTFTAEAGKEYALWSNASYVEADKIQIELGSTATDYKPYSGNTYTIQLGDTVYGGTLDVTNGTLTVDRAMVTFDGSSDEYWSLQSVNSYGIANFYTSVDHYPATNYRTACNMLSLQTSVIATTETEGYFVHHNGSSVYIRILSSRASTVNEFKTWLSQNNIQLVYTLATPITINLDPVQIATIANQTNNVWADAGDVTVEYAADLKTYIDNKIAAAVAAMS